MKKRVLKIAIPAMVSVIIISLGVFFWLTHKPQIVLSTTKSPEQVKTVSQKDAPANQNSQDSVQSLDTSTQNKFSSNFTYTHNKNLSIQDNVAAESLEVEAVKQWDTRLSVDDSQWDTSLSGNSYAKTFKQLYSLHPPISGSASLMQALTLEIKANTSFKKLSVDELQRLFDSAMYLEGYIYPQTSAIITVVDPSENKIVFSDYEMGNGYSSVALSVNSSNVWQTLMGSNASESMLEDGAKKFKSAGQDLYNVFHSTINTQSNTSTQASNNIPATLPTTTQKAPDVPSQTPVQPPTIALPNVMGKTLLETRDILEKQDNIVMSVDGNDLTVDPSDMIVVDMSPKPGTQVQPNGSGVQADVVNITVSKKPDYSNSSQEVTIVQPNVYPNVVGKTIEAALNIFKQDNISPEVIYVPTAPGPTGIVIDMTPKAGEQVKSIGGGYQVGITVSGKSP